MLGFTKLEALKALREILLIKEDINRDEIIFELEKYINHIQDNEVDLNFKIGNNLNLKFKSTVSNQILAEHAACSYESNHGIGYLVFGDNLSISNEEMVNRICKYFISDKIEDRILLIESLKPIKFY